MIKNLIPLLTFLLFSAGIYAQGGVSLEASPSASKNENVILQGEFLQKPWSKTTQSFCAQGSDYYVLKAAGKEHVLQLKKSFAKRLKKKSGKTVKLRGNFVTRTIEFDDNLQHPVSTNPVTGEEDTDYDCTVFEVEKILR